jgi:hypothetical protein
MGWDALEHYLDSAAILNMAHFAQHGAHRSYRLILEGGVGALAEPADTIQHDPRNASRSSRGRSRTKKDCPYHESLVLPITPTQPARQFASA